MIVGNVKRLVDDLRKRGAHHELVGAYETAALAQACRADLKQAILSLSALDAFTEAADQPTETLRVIQQSLIYTALILYVRAAHGSAEPGGRGAVSQTKKLLPAELRAIHDDLVDVRNKAVAHVHLGDSVDDFHQQYGIMFPMTGFAGWNTAIVSRSHMFDPKLVAKLKKVVPAAEQVLHQRYKDAIAAAARFFNSANIDMTEYVGQSSDMFGDDEHIVIEAIRQQGLGVSATIMT